MNEHPRFQSPPLAQAVPPAGFALWNLGFRPFYLLASLFGSLSILLWAAHFSGILPSAYLSDPLWHAHEMLFGFTTAIIAGFLLTAVRTWTGQSTPSGLPLMVLAALWTAGRILVWTPFAMTSAVLNIAFPIAVALAIAIPLLKAQNKRNYFFIGLFLLMSALIATAHMAMLGRFDLAPQRIMQLELDLVLFVMVVMGGRVIPMFTNNAIPGTNAGRKPWLEKLALASTIFLFAADLLQPSPVLAALVALTGAAAHGTRLALWKPWRTLSTPLVWILHAAYAWIVIHLLLRGMSELGLIAGSYAAHALTVGAIGGLTLGMMTRTARGHTGRLLVADRFELAIFILIQIAAIIRVFGGIASPGFYLASIELSGLLWTLSFGLYFVRYWPVLTKPRLDGKPG